MKRLLFIVPLVFLLIGKSLAQPPPKDGTDESARFERRIEELEDRLKAIEKRQSIASRFSLPDSVDFCGKPIPLERWHVREILDRELLKLSYERRQIATWLKRKEKFFPFIEAELQARQLPDCLKYLPVQESSLLEETLSSAGASGLWQFMANTGRKYDLLYNYYIDERRNFKKATAAALDHLRGLYNEFGDWPLALAAYNAGKNKVNETMEEQGHDEYWDLYFYNRSGQATETNTFVYRIIALQLVLGEPGRYGFFLTKEDYFSFPETQIIAVTLKVRTDLTAIKAFQGIPLPELKRLNPWIRRKMTLPPGEYLVIVPAAD